MQTDIYLANKVKGADREDGRDYWKTTKIDGCEYITSSTSKTSNRVNENSMALTLLIPFTGEYQPYNQFKCDLRGFTISTGDYVYLEKPTAEIDANNCVKIHSKFSDTSFQVQSFNVVQKRQGLNYEIKVVG